MSPHESIGDGLTPAQQVGMAWAHIDKAFGLLKKASEGDAVILARSDLEAMHALVDGARTPVSWSDLPEPERTWRSVLDELDTRLKEILE